ncbi:MAG: glycerate kinase [Deltaproteobacteria bacterium]|nr:MAG: glycerate kinase [Deltaproteobacteria bacterium]
MNSLLKDLNEITEAAIHAVDPYHAIKASCTLVQGLFRIRDRVFQPADPDQTGTFSFDISKGRLFVVGAGKAASRMALAIEEIAGDAITEGLVVTKYGYVSPLKRIRQIEAGHPVPDEKGVRGAREIEQLLKETRPEDLVLVLISGGGSSLLPYPAEGITLQDKQAVTQLLLSCGANIHEMNTVRKHLSGIKGGQLARMAAPAHVVSLILSDVIGDNLSVIASGPTAPDDSTFGDALEILSRFELTDKVPPEVITRLKDGDAGKIRETPDSRDPIFKKAFFRFIGSNQIALEAAAKKADTLGYRPITLTNAACGEAREIAKYFAAIARQAVKHHQPLPPPVCILSGGEPTVTLTGNGKGGRNQEFALAAGLEIGDLEDVLVASVGTDGSDGPTDAAGGYADGEMLRKARAHGLDPRDFLARNDAYHFLERLGYLIKTGPTGTNVMDIQIILHRKI